MALILAVQIEAPRLHDGLKVLPDPLPLLPGVRGRLLEAAFHRLAVDANGLGRLENSRFDLTSGILGKIDRHLAAPDFVVQHLRLVKLGTRGAHDQLGPARVAEVAHDLGRDLGQLLA
ncbi:hypothetical protein, partial [Paracoccus niistensis]